MQTTTPIHRSLLGLTAGLLLLAAAPASSHADTVTYTINFTDTVTLPNYIGISGTVSFDAADIVANPGGWIFATDYSFIGTMNGRAYAWAPNGHSPSAGYPLQGRVNAAGTRVSTLNGRTLYNTEVPFDFALDFWGVGDSMVRVFWGSGSGGKTQFAIGDVVVPVDPNTPPTADAGADQTVYVGATVALNGSASFDAETASQDLGYAWTLAGPVGSAAVLTGAGTATPSFVADVAGSYALSLTVTDAGSLTGSDEVIITVEDPKEAAKLLLTLACDEIDALTPSQVTTKGNQKALCNFIEEAFKDIDKGKFEHAIKKLQDALGKTDGCALRGAVDGKGSSQDWITTCESQEFVYQLLTKAVAALQAVPAP